MSTSRNDLRRQGEALQAKLFGAPDTAGERKSDGLQALLSEAAYGAVWSRPGLALPDRMVCALAALAAVQRLPQLRRHVPAALDLGLEPAAIREIIVQIGIYAGFTASELALESAAAALAERGIVLPDDPVVEEPLEVLTARGQQLMQQLHGARSGQGYAAPGNTVTGALYPLAIQYGYGAIWFRPGLDIRRRALVAVAAFTALKLDQVKKFGESALNVGLTRTEVIEAVVQTAPISGFAPALNALGALSDVLG